jgi:polyisoprenoid-binding protein YceI
MSILRLLGIAAAVMLAVAPARAQQPDPFGTRRADSSTRQGPSPAGDTGQRANAPAPAGEIDPRLAALDSVVYRLAPTSRLKLKTGKAGLFGFAGHTHDIQARAFHGQVVYYPKSPSQSRLDITVITDSLEVLTPPDTAEIRKVTEAMRTEVLHTAEHHEIRLVSRQVTPAKDGFHIVGALTIVGQTREVPIDVQVRLGLDTLQAASTFSVKQTDFGIKPYSGGPGGTVKVADRVTFDILAIGVRSAADTSRTGAR